MNMCLLLRIASQHRDMWLSNKWNETMGCDRLTRTGAKNTKRDNYLRAVVFKSVLTSVEAVTSAKIGFSQQVTLVKSSLFF